MNTLRYGSYPNQMKQLLADEKIAWDKFWPLREKFIADDGKHSALSAEYEAAKDVWFAISNKITNFNITPL